MRQLQSQIYRRKPESMQEILVNIIIIIVILIIIVPFGCFAVIVEHGFFPCFSEYILNIQSGSVQTPTQLYSNMWDVWRWRDVQSYVSILTLETGVPQGSSHGHINF